MQKTDIGLEQTLAKVDGYLSEQRLNPLKALTVLHYLNELAIHFPGKEIKNLQSKLDQCLEELAKYKIDLRDISLKFNQIPQFSSAIERCQTAVNSNEIITIDTIAPQAPIKEGYATILSEIEQLSKKYDLDLNKTDLPQKKLEVTKGIIQIWLEGKKNSLLEKNNQASVDQANQDVNKLEELKKKLQQLDADVTTHEKDSIKEYTQEYISYVTQGQSKLTNPDELKIIKDLIIQNLVYNGFNKTVETYVNSLAPFSSKLE